MRLIRVAVGLSLALASAQSARADGLIYQLPADGGQVRYEMVIALNAEGNDLKLKGSISVSSVGQVTENGEKCRWIEFKMITDEGGLDRTVISKALIPEKHLGKGKSPVDNLIRVWVKEGDGEPQEIRDFKGQQLLALRAFLAGPVKNPAELEKIEIDGKLGKLPCAGATGDLEIEVGMATLGMNYENRLNEKAPFGVVAGNWKFDLKNNGQAALAGTLKLTLTDTNTTALSELPNNK